MITAMLTAIKAVLTFLTGWGPLAGLVSQLASWLGTATFFVWTAVSGVLFAMIGGILGQITAWLGKGVLRVAFMPFAWLGRYIRGKVRRA